MTVLAIVLGLLAVWLVFTFNKLVGLKNQVLNAFRQIDVQLKRRHDLIPNLVNSVKGEMKFEKETLENVIQARAAAVNAGQGGNMNEVLAKEGMLTQALGKLFALTENYPNLKSDAAFRDLQAQLEGTENRVTVARNRFIEKVAEYNSLIRVFPNNLTAWIFNYDPKPSFTVENEAAISTAPVVDFGAPPKPED